jgi:hypothetical protein
MTALQTDSDTLRRSLPGHLDERNDGLAHASPTEHDMVPNPVSLAQQLIRFPSLNPPGDEKACVDFPMPQDGRALPDRRHRRGECDL